MKLGHRSSWFPTTTTLTLGAVSVLFFQSVILFRASSALSINKRESVTEQVLIITTQTESPEFNDEVGEFGSTGYSGSATTPPAMAQGLVLAADSEQSDQAAVSTTVDTIIVQDTTGGGGGGGEIWEVDPTSSSIISKDVEIEIATSENSNKVLAQGDSAASGGASQEVGNSKVCTK